VLTTSLSDVIKGNSTASSQPVTRANTVPVAQIEDQDRLRKIYDEQLKKKAAEQV
jgi:hypothetical protein